MKQILSVIFLVVCFSCESDIEKFDKSVSLIKLKEYEKNKRPTDYGDSLNNFLDTFHDEQWAVNQAQKAVVIKLDSLILIENGGYPQDYLTAYYQLINNGQKTIKELDGYAYFYDSDGNELGWHLLRWTGFLEAKSVALHKESWRYNSLIELDNKLLFTPKSIISTRLKVNKADVSK